MSLLSFPFNLARSYKHLYKYFLNFCIWTYLWVRRGSHRVGQPHIFQILWVGMLFVDMCRYVFLTDKDDGGDAFFGRNGAHGEAEGATADDTDL